LSHGVGGVSHKDRERPCKCFGPCQGRAVAKRATRPDGSCMTSAACQNPSLTYMALTARAAHYAVEEMKRGNL